MLFTAGFFLGSLITTLVLVSAVYITILLLSYISTHKEDIPNIKSVAKTTLGFMRPQTPQEKQDIVSGKRDADEAMTASLLKLRERGEL
jgi:hypothetical protein